MCNMIETARKLGYIDVPDNVFIDIDSIKSYPDDSLVIITTGSQGEPMSALTRMASGEHRKVQITPNDLIIISANPIPGNEKYISKVIDDLMSIRSRSYLQCTSRHTRFRTCMPRRTKTNANTCKTKILHTSSWRIQTINSTCRNS